MFRWVSCESVENFNFKPESSFIREITSSTDELLVKCKRNTKGIKSLRN